MSTEAETSGQGTLRGAQREYGHAGDAPDLAAMQATHVAHGASCAYCLDPWPCDTAHLLAADARWRALVGELLAATTEWMAYEGNHRTARPRSRDQRLTAAINAAQAARDGTG